MNDGRPLGVPENPEPDTETKWQKARRVASETFWDGNWGLNRPGQTLFKWLMVRTNMAVLGTVYVCLHVIIAGIVGDLRPVNRVALVGGATIIAATMVRYLWLAIRDFKTGRTRVSRIAQRWWWFGVAEIAVAVTAVFIVVLT